MTQALAPHREFIPEAQFPDLETLKSQPMGSSDIFPTIEPDDPLGPLGNYHCATSPAPASPLYPLMGNIKAIRERVTAEHKGYSGQDERIKKVMDATRLQRKLLSHINKGYWNLIYSGVSHTDAPYEIAAYVEERDQEKSEEYRGNIVYYEGLVEALQRGDRLSIPNYVIDEAFADGLEEVDPEPVSSELQREAYKRTAMQTIDINQRRLERLDFEWLTSMVAVDRLTESLADKLTPQMATT